MPDPEERHFDTYAGYQTWVLEALGLARRTLLVFDPDLAGTGLESPAALAALRALALASPERNAIRILVRDARYLERNAPRLLDFIGRFGHRAAVRIAAGDNESVETSFLVVDGQHLVLRFHADRPRGKVCLADSGSLSVPAAQFETIWKTAQPGPSGTGLGL